MVCRNLRHAYLMKVGLTQNLAYHETFVKNDMYKCHILDLTLVNGIVSK
jgi:hypothetical protein